MVLVRQKQGSISTPISRLKRYSVCAQNGLNGTVSVHLPYNFNGQLIEDFQLTFKDGEVVDYKAEKGRKR